MRPSFAVERRSRTTSSTKSLSAQRRDLGQPDVQRAGQRAADRPRRPRDSASSCTTASSRRRRTIRTTSRATPTTASATSSPRASISATTSPALPTERFIDRWNLDAGPIVFTLTNEIPPTYRDTVRRGDLGLERRLRQDRLPARDRGARSARPIRISIPRTRATTASAGSRRNTPGFVAESPHVSDPDTGQIIRAEVVIDGESMRAVRRGYVDRVAAGSAGPLRTPSPRLRRIRTGAAAESTGQRRSDVR